MHLRVPAALLKFYTGFSLRVVTFLKKIDFFVFKAIVEFQTVLVRLTDV